jgi:hypothetical protein
MAKGLAQSFKAQITDIDITPMEPLGIIRYTDNGVYKYVKFSGTTANAANDPVGYVVSDLTLQTVDGAVGTNYGAGIAQGAVVSGTVQYGWIQIGGVALANNTTGTAGQPLYYSAAKTLAVKSAVTQTEVGILIAAGTPAPIQLICGN